MNNTELKIEMMRHGDNGEDLAKVLNITRQTLSRKMNDPESDFTQKEIRLMIDRYGLSGDRVKEIFFADEVS